MHEHLIMLIQHLQTSDAWKMSSSWHRCPRCQLPIIDAPCLDDPSNIPVTVTAREAHSHFEKEILK